MHYNAMSLAFISSHMTSVFICNIGICLETLSPSLFSEFYIEPHIYKEINYTRKVLFPLKNSFSKNNNQETDSLHFNSQETEPNLRFDIFVIFCIVAITAHISALFFIDN